MFTKVENRERSIEEDIKFFLLVGYLFSKSIIIDPKAFKLITFDHSYFSPTL